MKTALVLVGVAWFGFSYLLLPEPADTGDRMPLVGATVISNEIPEACPFVVRVTIANSGESELDVALDMRHSAALEEATSLVLRSSEGTVHRLNYTGKPQANRYSLPVPRRMAPGTVVEFDRVFAPLWWGREEDAHAYGYQFVPPGEYSGTVLLAYAPGRSAASSPFDLRVTEAIAEDGAARDKIAVEIAVFLYGGEPPSRADAGDKLLLEEIVKNHRASRYAEWIRFWTLYHDGPAQQAVEYARAHPTFPLSDNLMLRVINRAADDDARHDEALGLLAELQRIFPDGDAAHQSKALEEKLLTKKRRP